MIAMAILGIVATVSAPSFQAWSRNYQLKSASNDLYSHMQMAKIGAVKENRPWTVNFNQNSIRGYNIKDGSGKVVNAVDFGAKYNQEIQYKFPTSSVEYDSATLTSILTEQAFPDLLICRTRQNQGIIRLVYLFPTVL
jgi:Tfp pilus assembly protein FimT